MVVLVSVVTSLTISELHRFNPFNVAATPAVTITPEPMPEPASNIEKTSTNNQDHEDDYQILIPDGAAWKETISERFYPQDLIVPPGSDVTWTNDDDLTHIITSGKKVGYGMYEFLQDGMFNSGELVEGESFTFHFAEQGRYEYFCVPHPWMTGAVIVQ